MPNVLRLPPTVWGFHNPELVAFAKRKLVDFDGVEREFSAVQRRPCRLVGPLETLARRLALRRAHGFFQRYSRGRRGRRFGFGGGGGGGGGTPLVQEAFPLADACIVNLARQSFLRDNRVVLVLAVNVLQLDGLRVGLFCPPRRYFQLLRLGSPFRVQLGLHVLNRWNRFRKLEFDRVEHMLHLFSSVERLLRLLDIDPGRCQLVVGVRDLQVQLPRGALVAGVRRVAFHFFHV